MNLQLAMLIAWYTSYDKCKTNTSVSFRRNLAESSWSSEGIETEITSQDEEKGTFDVVCRSSHLTSFAVLLDINDVLPKLSVSYLLLV